MAFPGVRKTSPCTNFHPNSSSSICIGWSLVKSEHRSKKISFARLTSTSGLLYLAMSLLRFLRRIMATMPDSISTMTSELMMLQHFKSNYSSRRNDRNSDLKRRSMTTFLSSVRNYVSYLKNIYDFYSNEIGCYRLIRRRCSF